MTSIDERPPATTDPRDADPAAAALDGSNTVSAALVRLVAVVAVVVGVCWWRDWLVPLVIVASLLAMIMLHELGHFASAKASGMKVTEYFLGFGPTLWSIRHGETRYGFKAIPLGGYVKIVGMHNLDQVDAVDEPRSYRQATFPRRLLVASAGSLMHVLIAFVLLVVLYAGFGRFAVVPVVSAVQQVSAGVQPAVEAGIRPGDRLVSIDGRPVQDFTRFREIVRASAGRPLTMVYVRDGQTRTTEITPAGVDECGQTVGRVGLVPSAVAFRTSWFASVPEAGRDIGTLIPRTVSALASALSPARIGSLFRQAEDARVGRQVDPGCEEGRFVSAVGAVKLASDAARRDWGDFVAMFIEINLFVAVFNMFPMLPLDGGHVVIAVYERIRSRRGRRYRVDIVKLLPAAYATVSFLIIIGVLSLYIDILRPPQLP